MFDLIDKLFTAISMVFCAVLLWFLLATIIGVDLLVWLTLAALIIRFASLLWRSYSRR